MMINKIQNPFELIDQRLQRIEEMLEQLLDNQPELLGQARKKKHYMTLAEAADLLRLSKQSIYRMTSTKTIPHLKHYSRLYFKQEDLLAWMETMKQPVKEN